MGLFESILDPDLRCVAEKFMTGQRLNKAALLCLLTTVDVNGVMALAESVRVARHGRKAYFGHSLNLNYTNVCELRCPLCAYSCDKEGNQAYVLELDEVRERVAQAVTQGVDEVHIVGGLNPSLSLDYYRGLVATVKTVAPALHVVAFTATEYDYMSRISGIDVKTLLAQFREAGVDALPGGGAEIFAPAVRQQIAPRKIDGARWLEVMRLAHEVGLRSNATLLYNHIETPEDVADHLHRLRALQDETGGFKALVPLPFHGANTAVRARREQASGMDTLRLFAAARIYLDNFDHIKALWMYVGTKLAQVLLSVAADDAGATYLNEKIVHAAGASTAASGSEAGLRQMIEDGGMLPVRTHAGYA